MVIVWSFFGQRLGIDDQNRLKYTSKIKSLRANLTLSERKIEEA